MVLFVVAAAVVACSIALVVLVAVLHPIHHAVVERVGSTDLKEVVLVYDCHPQPSHQLPFD